MATIPTPEYINEIVEGAIVTIDGQNALVIGVAEPAGALIARGTFAIRYAVPMMNPPLRWVVPGLFVGERGGVVTGRRA